jgi:hypothetical protein
MRRTLASLMPVARAMVRVLQCVALGGFSCKVISTTFFTRPSLMMRVLPGRGASFSRAAMPPSRKRFRHRAAVSGMMPISAAICLFSRPSEARSTVPARSTTRAASERRRARRCNAVFCSGLNNTIRALRMISPSHSMDADHA